MARQMLMVGRIGPLFREQLQYDRTVGQIDREEVITACRTCGDEAGVYYVNGWPEDGWEFCPPHSN
jgi:hypothetical protein